MRITNSEYTPIQILSEIIGAAGSGLLSDEKEELFGNFFTADRRDSHDWIVPAWRERIDAILGAYRRHDTYCIDTQSILDQGIDVRLQQESLDGGRTSIGFQLKSNMEAKGNRSRSKGVQTLVGTLKAQQSDAQRHGGLQEWWIVCCFEMPKFRRLLGAINSAFSTGDERLCKFPSRIVQPFEAAAFLSMDLREVDLYATLFLCSEDGFLQAAKKEMGSLSPEARQVVYDIFGDAVEGEYFTSMEDLHDVLVRDNHFDGSVEDPLDTLDALECTGFICVDWDGPVKVKPAAFPGLCALYFELRVRHEAAPGEAIAKAAWLVGRSLGRDARSNTE